MIASNREKGGNESRRAILDRLRTQTIEGPPLPETTCDGLIRFDDELAQFELAAESVGAAVYRVQRAPEVAEHLGQLVPFQQARRVASLVPDAVSGNTDLEMFDDPHYLKGLDWLITGGEFGVAENGAIWMDMRNMNHRVSFFITQYLVIVLRASEVVPHMHAAYERLGERVSQPFGLFLSGPSKTADIEQSLVLGAHGCRALHVFLLED